VFVETHVAEPLVAEIIAEDVDGPYTWVSGETTTTETATSSWTTGTTTDCVGRYEEPVLWSHLHDPSALVVGIARSSKPDEVWAQLQGDTRALYGVSDDGTTRALKLSGLTTHPWIGLTAGPCGNEACLYLAQEVPSTNGPAVLLHRFPQPTNSQQSAHPAASMHMVLPYGSGHVSALLVDTDETVTLLTDHAQGFQLLSAPFAHDRVGAHHEGSSWEADHVRAAAYDPKRGAVLLHTGSSIVEGLLPVQWPLADLTQIGFDAIPGLAAPSSSTSGLAILPGGFVHATGATLWFVPCF
jgi:hypothetical protein